MEGDYIYFRSDYDTEPMPINDTQFIEPTHYNIRRISVNEPTSEAELVAEDVFEYCDLGISDGKFYYSPKEYGEKSKGYYYNFTSGKIKCVDLQTLECTDLVTDSGFMFEGHGNVIVNDRYIITLMRPIWDNGYDWTLDDGSRYTALYDFATGDMYALID